MAQVLVATEAAKMWSTMPDNIKQGIGAGLEFTGGTLKRFVGLPITIVMSVINLIVLSIIFVWTMYLKLGNMRDAFLKGIGFALAATVIFAITNFLSGGFAAIILFFVYPLAAFGMWILSLIAPSFMDDIHEEKNGVEVSRISAYRLWSISFWTIFILGMILSLILAGVASYIGANVVKVVGDVASGFLVKKTDVPAVSS